jgi:hypothetical protein
MMHDYDRFASLFTPDGAVRIPDISAELARREEDLRPWRVHPRRPAAARPGSLHLAQLGHRGSGQAQPHRLPLTTSFKESII